MADYVSLSSDPFVKVELKTSGPKRHKQDSNLTRRTPTQDATQTRNGAVGRLSPTFLLVTFI